VVVVLLSFPCELRSAGGAMYVGCCCYGVLFPL
jgi:hypothetical protein